MCLEREWVEGLAERGGLVVDVESTWDVQLQSGLADEASEADNIPCSFGGIDIFRLHARGRRCSLASQTPIDRGSPEVAHGTPW